jgi:hypothetical protein
VSCSIQRLQLALSVNCNGADVDVSGWVLMIRISWLSARSGLGSFPGVDGAGPALPRRRCADLWG